MNVVSVSFFFCGPRLSFFGGDGLSLFPLCLREIAFPFAANLVFPPETFPCPPPFSLGRLLDKTLQPLASLFFGVVLVTLSISDFSPPKKPLLWLGRRNFFWTSAMFTIFISKFPVRRVDLDAEGCSFFFFFFLFESRDAAKPCPRSRTTRFASFWGSSAHQCI